MKELYIKPEIQIEEFQVEGILCSSNGDPGGTAPDFDLDNSWPANSIR